MMRMAMTPKLEPTSPSGLALVEYSKIPNVRPAWGFDPISAKDALDDFTSEFDDLKEPHAQAIEEHDEEGHAQYIDWASWTPPKVTLALFRRTAPSCYVQDWEGLEKDWMKSDEMDFAQSYPQKYARSQNVRNHYPPGFLLAHSGTRGQWREVRVPLESGEVH